MARSRVWGRPEPQRSAMARDDGTPVQVGDWWWVENGQVHFAPPATDIPNRLYGATINHEGDAV